MMGTPTFTKVACPPAPVGPLVVAVHVHVCTMYVEHKMSAVDI